MPSRSTVYLWLAQNREFSDQYARACEVRAHELADEIIEIADDGRNDTYEDGDGNEHVNTDVIARSRLRVDSRKWLASKLAPKRYGDKVEQVISGGDKPVEQKVTVWELVPFSVADGPKD
jgi:terminase small subunit-like protein